MHINPLLLHRKSMLLAALPWHLISPHIAALPLPFIAVPTPCLAVSVLGRSLSCIALASHCVSHLCIALAVRCVTHPCIAIALKSKPTLYQATATLIYSIAEMVTTVPFHGISGRCRAFPWPFKPTPSLALPWHLISIPCLAIAAQGIPYPLHGSSIGPPYRRSGLRYPIKVNAQASRSLPI